MLSLNEMRQKKYEMGLSYQQISERSGVPLGTVQKVFAGITKAPRHATLCALEHAFEDPDGIYVPERSDYSEITLRTETRIAEAVPAYGEKSDREKYPRQGSYTVKDYLALPDDQRVELIDGVFYDMSAPNPVHQDICFMLGYYFQNFIEENHGSCHVLLSPIDVQLDKDDKTMLQPDVCIICDPTMIHDTNLFGAPDLLIEILSKSTRKKDLTLKNTKYCGAGVREYWTVDPMKLKITVFDYEHDGEITIYGFHDTVPVGIYDGKLKINFETIYKRIKGMYGVGNEVSSDGVHGKNGGGEYGKTDT